MLYPHITTPLLVANNIFDSSQLSFAGWSSGGNSMKTIRTVIFILAGQYAKEYQAYFGENVVTTIQEISNMANKTKDGYWLPGCYAHTSNLHFFFLIF